MHRVVLGSTPTLSQTFYGDGEEPTDVGAVTVHIVAADGSDVVPAGTATTPDGVGVYTFALPAAATADLGDLTVTWTAANGAQRVSVVEVVGGRLFELAELRAEPDLSSAQKYPTAKLARARDSVEERFERYCGVAFFPQYHRDVLDGGGAHEIPLTHVYVRELIACTVGGTAVDADAVTVTSSGVLRHTGFFPFGRHNVVVEYSHGMDAPPADLREAALMYARHLLIDWESRNLSNVRSRIFDVGVELLSTPGDDRATGLPDVDAVLNGHRVRIPKAG